MKKLYRSRANKKIAGICGGLGEFFEIDPTIIRLAAIFLLVSTGAVPGLVTYIIGWILIPDNPAQ